MTDGTQHTGGQEKTDSYLEGAQIGGTPADVEMEGGETIRPMTNDELREVWKGKQGDAAGNRTDRWKKGLKKDADRPGDWGAFGTRAHGPSSSSGESSGTKVHETRSNARRAGEYKYGGGLQKPASVETKKEATKHSKPGKPGGQQDNQVPPRGGQKK